MLFFRGADRRSVTRRLRLSLVGVGLLALSTAVPASAAASISPSSAASISRGGLTVAVPPRGMGVRASAIMVSGEVRALQVETTDAGRVVVIEAPAPATSRTIVPGLRSGGPAGAARAATAGRATAAAPVQSGVAPAGSPAACDDPKRKVTISWWHSTFEWSFKSSSKPSSMTSTTAERELKQAMKNITQSRNDCGLPDEVNASASYLGRTTRGTRIGSNSSCNVTDNHNVVAFGDLSPSTVGFTCWWYQGNRTLEADVQLNKTDFDWVAAGDTCFDAFVVQGVATHELGHVFGLGHVSQAGHANLTMSAAIYPCDNSDSSLGLGDVLGLRTHY